MPFNETPQEYKDWCVGIVQQMLEMFINRQYPFNEEIRNAALTAIRALDWLSEPEERIEVKYKKRPFTVDSYPPK